MMRLNCDLGINKLSSLKVITLISWTSASPKPETFCPEGGDRMTVWFLNSTGVFGGISMNTSTIFFLSCSFFLSEKLMSPFGPPGLLIIFLLSSGVWELSACTIRLAISLPKP